MKRKIIPKQKYTTYASFPLVSGDVRAYEIELDLGQDVTGAEFKVVAIRSDGKAIEDLGKVTDGVATYTLANSMYSVPGELTVRLQVLQNASVLTDREIVFEVLEGTQNASQGSTVVPLNDSIILRLSTIEDKLFGKVDKETGKGLSTNDFTADYKAKLDNLDETIGTELERVSKDVDNLSDEVLEHKSDRSNPHGVTALQVGAYTKADVDNMLNSKADKSEVNTEINRKAAKDEVYTKAELYTQTQIDNKLATINNQLAYKANKADITNVYKFCGSVPTFDGLPFAYQLIPNGEPTKNGEVCGKYSEDTDINGLHRYISIDTTFNYGDVVSIPIVPITVKAGNYTCKDLSDVFGLDFDVTVGNCETLYGSFATPMGEQTIEHIEVAFNHSPDEPVDYPLYIETDNLGELQKLADSWLLGDYFTIPEGAYDNGAVYNVLDTGMNYAWNGTSYDALGGEHKDLEAREDIENIETQMGDIETALDSIIEIQNSLTGGDSV